MVALSQSHFSSAVPARSLLLALLMLLSTWTPMVLPANAQPSTVTEWGSGGHNDTGWIRLDATGADPAMGQMAIADMHHLLAPGALLDNITFEVRVDGANDLWVEQPQLSFVDTQTAIMDWRGLGGFGQQNDLLGPDPHSSRLAPNVNTGASWLVPGGAEVTDLVIEALRPVDPLISFSPVTLDVTASAVHPGDGRLYVAVGDALLQLDANNNPMVIELDEDVATTALVVDVANDRVVVATDDGGFRVWALSDSSELLPLPSLPGGAVAGALELDSSGTLWAGTTASDLFSYGAGGWTDALNPSVGSDEVTDMLEVGGDMLLATLGGGVMRLDLANGQWKSAWDTQNHLPSDYVNQLLEVNGVLMIAMDDAGIARWSVSTASWLATWTDANWLASNEVRGMATGAGWLHILLVDTLHHYNTTMGAFTSSKTLASLGLPLDGLDLVAWPAGGARAPSVDTVFVNDGSGQMARIVPGNPPLHSGSALFASGPASDQMNEVIEVNGIVWIASNGLIDRFDRSINRWLDPIVNNVPNVALATDGASVWVGTIDGGIEEYDASNGTLTTQWNTHSGLNNDFITDLAWDASNNLLVATHPNSGASIIDVSSGNVTSVWDSQRSDVFSNNLRQVATLAGIAYFASANMGVLRLDLGNDTLLTSWRSTGMDNVPYMPVETDGATIWLGMFGYGVLVYDRLTGELTDTYQFTRGGATISSNDVYSLHIDTQGDLWVGTSGGADRYDGSTWSHIRPTGQAWQPTEFYDFDSDSAYLYAGTNAGACQYSLATLNREDCWNYYSNPGLPSSWVYGVTLILPGILMAGTNYGAGIIDVVNDTVLDTWEAGEQTWNAKTYLYDDVAYVALDGVGIARYDMTTDEWLTTWDSDHSNGLLSSDGITALIPALVRHQIWVGGDFGLNLIDLDNESLEVEWDKGSNGGTATVPTRDPAELVIIGDTMYYLQERTNAQSNDNIYRYDIVNFTGRSTIDADDALGSSALVYGAGIGPDGHLWVGTMPSQWWIGGDGIIARWDHWNSTWASNIAPTGPVSRVTARYAGDCAPLNTSACDLYVHYGESVHRRIAWNGTLLNEWDENTLEGPVRNVVTYDGLVMFATADGIARYNAVNDTWLPSWTPGSGLPSNSEDPVYAMTVVGDDLWYTSMANGGWNRNSRIFRMNGTTGQWTSWEAGGTNNNVPLGFGFSFEVCRDILHIGMARYSGFGTQGGVARYDLSTNQWHSAFTQGGGGQGNQGLADDDVHGLACDDTADILYIGFNEDDVGISRYAYARNQYLPTLSETANGISPDPVFPDGMGWAGGALMISHVTGDGGAGGISRIPTAGASVGGGAVIDWGFEAASLEVRPAINPGFVEWVIGRPGAATGFNRVDLFNASGLLPGEMDVLAGLPSGRVLEVIYSGNDVYVAMADDDNTQYGSSVLHGVLLPSGSVEWQQAWSLAGDYLVEMLLDGSDIWVSTAGGGLWRIDLTTGTWQTTPAALHGQMDGLWMDGSEIVVGLMGTSWTAAGVQVFNKTTNSWDHGKLLAGLPSNIVRDFLLYDNRIWVATWGGLGVWNISSQAWDDPITTMDGLPSGTIEHLWNQGGELWLGTPAGLVRFDVASLSVIGTIDRNSGLVGNRVSGFALAPQVTISSGNTSVTLPAALYLSHNGEGSTRPGASALDISTLQVIQQLQVDMLPSNDVRAIAADWWGVHIATSEEPLVHWKAATSKMEAGSSQWMLLAWPVRKLVSDGRTLVVVTPAGIDRIDVQGAQHAVVGSVVLTGTTSAWVGSTGMWSTAGDGLHGWTAWPAFIELDRESMRRADPLTVTFSGFSADITDSTRPGQWTQLISASDNVTTSMQAGGISPGSIPLHQLSLTMSSPVTGAAVWVSSHNLNYSGTWNLTELSPTLAADFDLAARRGALTPSGRDLHIQLQSTLNGSIEIRFTYDWTRSESPVALLDLFDRPDDGGGVLTAEWTPSSDHGWAAYRIYLKVGNWTTPPTAFDLTSATYDARVPVWTVTMADIATAEGQPIMDGDDIHGIVVQEYADGSLGEPSDIIGPAQASDEVPAPPAWANAGPAEGGEDGDLYVEWDECSALDHAGTRLWAVRTEITDAIGLPQQGSDVHEDSNSTVLRLERGRVYWVALTCVDEVGQHDPANATIVGPVVPMGGVDDGIPPAPVEDIKAYDTPDDEGGMITVEWTPNNESDCAWHAVMARPLRADEDDTQPPGDALDFLNSTIVADCESGMANISDWGGLALEDNVLYWITVVAFDVWGNGDLVNVTIVQASPERNMFGSDPPPRLQNLSAWDHPDDDGRAVDVEWDASEVMDFGYYVVWASDHPVDDLTVLYPNCRDDLAACGATVLDRQYSIDGSSMRVAVTITTAIYGGDSVVNGTPGIIRPDVPLYVTVTAHDLLDAAFLTRLPSLVVTPIDNRDDIVPPDRLEAPVVTDFPDDNGTAVYVEFTPSGASDLDHYEVYADIIKFTSTGPRQPAMVIGREVQQPFMLTNLSDGQSIMSGIPVYVAIVPVDSSGNAHRDHLNVGNGRAVDNSDEDPGAHLPDVDFSVGWSKHGESIEIEWVPLTGTGIRGYRIYVSEERFEMTGEAALLKEGIVGSFWELDEWQQDVPFDNSTEWYIAVVAFDGENWKHAVRSKEMKAFDSTSSEEDGPGTNEATAGIGDLLTLNNVLSVLLMLAIMSIIFMMVRVRSNRRDSQAWELVTGAWGLPQDKDDGSWGDTSESLSAPASPDVDLEGTLMPAASVIQAEEQEASKSDITTARATAPTDASARLADLASDLFDEPRKGGDADDDDLDSLIDDLL